MTTSYELQCAEVLGGTEAIDLSVRLPGIRGEVWSRPYAGDPVGGDIHYLAACAGQVLSKVVVADVSGHGARVADAARVLHQALADHVNAHDHGQMLGCINRSFLSHTHDTFRFSTIILEVL
jgi:phosphoserine phosphatase RsbU/P